MEVALISKTENPIETMYIAARTCYSAESPNSMVLKTIVLDNAEKLIKQVLSSGHLSIAEHVNFTFAIRGISRACSHQLVRHRHCTFSQQSQRYVEIKGDVNKLKDLLQKVNNPDEDISIKANIELHDIAEQYFVEVNNNNCYQYINALINYLEAIASCVKPEDARMFLPNATKTNLVMTCNLAELMHICNLRLCSRSQREIRVLFQEMKKRVTEYNEFMGSLLVPSCEVHGICFEHKCCKRNPSIKDVKKIITRDALFELNAKFILEDMKRERNEE